MVKKRNSLIEKLEEFISKYYQNLLIKGAIFFITSFTLFFIFFSFLEFVVRFDSSVRSIIFWLFLSINALVFYKWVIVPLLGLYRIGKSLSHKEAARIIGLYFSDVQDKLLNILQLQDLSQSQNELIEASIEQKSSELKAFRFSKAIDYRQNLKYIKFATIPFCIIVALYLSGNKEMITESSERIISYNKEFIEKAPFEFEIQNTKLQVIQGENLKLELKLIGNEIPNEVEIVFGNNIYYMNSNKTGLFSYEFKNLQKSLPFNFSASTFSSANYTIEVLPKPIILKLNTKVKYPTYINKVNESFQNKGNLFVPEGSLISWEIETENASELFVRLEKEGVSKVLKKENNVFLFQQKITESQDYSILVLNQFASGDSLLYSLKVIKDKFPSIQLEEYTDSTNSAIKFVSGQIDDDYGLTKLTFNFRSFDIKDKWKSKEINIRKNETTQLFSYLIDFDSLTTTTEQGIEYYFEVWDNDQINGNKSSRSSQKQYLAPSQEQLENELETENEGLKEKMEQTQKLAKEIQKDLEELKKQILKEKELSWEQKNKAKEIVKKQEELKKQIQEIETQQAESQEKSNRLNNKKEDLLQKQKQIQELFENIMDQEMKDMMNELNEKMDDIDKEELKNLIDEMQQDDEDVEKELDRTLELFKQMELEQKLEKNADRLQKLAEKQKELAKKTIDKNQDQEQLKKEQEEIQKEFQDILDELKEAQKLNDELENKKNIADTKEQELNIGQEMKESLEKLVKNLKKQASKSQKKAGDKMQEMSQSIQDSIAQDEAETVAEDMETLRQILENLISLSFDQEQLINNLQDVKFNNPIYTQYMRDQSKLIDDSQIIEDSLFALSKRQPQIEAIINSEINNMNANMEKALSFMEERKSAEASEKQQFAMMSANNLALLLSEVLEQMQKQMTKSNPNPSNKMCNKPKSLGGESMKKLKQMQEALKESMKKMLNGNKGKQGKNKKGGKQSEEIAKMAAQQERIRNRLNEIRNELSGDQNSKNNIDKLLQDMEKTQSDIINNNITQSTLLRQEQIMNRLLEAEKAQLERDKEKQRESNEWLNNLSKKLIDPYQEYIQKKKKQEELIKTIPPSFTPFYKNKVNQYFKNEQ
jgi:hypothetical protein